MSDLISRSELKKTLLKYNYTTEHNQIFRYIDEQPTAYSVDKVVEELEKELEKGNIAIDFREFRLFEIVKQGVVYDDVCEWKRDDMCDTVYKVCGGCFTSEYQKDFKFCPYCGKKIKVVK